MNKKIRKTKYLSLIALTAFASLNNLNASSKCVTSKDDSTLPSPWPYLSGKTTGNLGISFNTHVKPPFEVAWEILNTTSFGGYAVQSQPTIVGNVLYSANAQGDIFALDAKTGAQKWITQIPSQLFNTSPSITADGYLYIAANIIYALDAATGEIKWQTSISNPNDPREEGGNTVVVEDKVIIGTSSYDTKTHAGALIAYNRFTGEKIWETAFAGGQYLGGSGIWSSPAVDLSRRLVFVGTGEAYGSAQTTPPTAPSPYTDNFVAVNLDTGKIEWAYSFGHYPLDVWNPAVPSTPGTYDLDVSGYPVLFSAKVKGKCVDLVGVSSKDGSYRIFTRDQENPNYVQPLTILQLDPAASIQGVSSRAIAHDGVLYVASTALIGQQGDRESLDYALANPSQTLALFFNHANIKTLALDIEKLLAAGNTNGTVPQEAIIWETTTPGMGIENPLTYGNGYLFQTSITGWVRVIDAKTGAELWRHTPLPLANPLVLVPTYITGGVTITNDMLYVGVGVNAGEGGAALPGGGIVAYKIASSAKN